MIGLGAVAVAICCASLICTLVSNFISDGSMKRVLNLILGAFMVCSLIVPVSTAIKSINSDYDQSLEAEEYSATDDEAYNKRVVELTRQNLEQALTAILSQNGVYPDKTEIILSVCEDNSIIISQARIYIDKENTQSDLINELTVQNFGIVPNIITQ